MNFFKASPFYRSIRRSSRRRRGEVRFLRCVSRDTLGSDDEFIGKLKEGKLRLREESNVKKCDFILVFCPVVSRSGTNIEEALKKLQDLSESKPAVLVVLHHTLNPDLTVPDSSRSVNRENTLTVDCLFEQDRGLLQCSTNQEALEKVIRWVKIQNVPQMAYTHGPTANPTDTQIKPKHESQRKDEVIRQLQHELQKKDEILQQHQQELQKKDKVLQQQQQELQKKDKVLQQQQQELQTKDKVLQQQQQELQRKDKVLQQYHELQRKDKVFGMVMNKLSPITKHDYRNQRQLEEKQVEDQRELLTEAEKLKITDKEITQKPDMTDKMFNHDSRNTILETEKCDPGTSTLFKKSKVKQEDEERRTQDESKSLKQQIVQTKKKDKRTSSPEIKGDLFSGNPPDLSQAGASISTQKQKTRQSFNETGAVQKRHLKQYHSIPWDLQMQVKKPVDPKNQVNNNQPEPPYDNKPLRRKKLVFKTQDSDQVEDLII